MLDEEVELAFNVFDVKRVLLCVFTILLQPYVFYVANVLVVYAPQTLVVGEYREVGHSCEVEVTFLH